VLATRALDYAIRIDTALLRTIESPIKRVADSEIRLGEQIVEPGLTGKVVRAWRVFQDKTRAERREMLSRDRYRETPTIIRYGAPPAAPWIRRVRNLFGMHG
jgi:hypothetical protein